MIYSPVILKYQRPIADRRQECFIELHNDYLHYVAKFWAEEPNMPEDESSGWQEVKNSVDIYAQRSAITLIQLALTDPAYSHSVVWKISIIVTGAANDIHIYFNRDEYTKAKEMFLTIRDWWVANL